MTAQNIVKKLSVKTVHGKVDPSMLDKNGTALFRIAGIARGFKSGSSTFGDWTALIGDFAAIKPDGEILRGSTLFVPDVILNMVSAQVEQNEAVEFIFDLVAIPDKSVNVGYTYAARTVVEPFESDPVSSLINRASEQRALTATATEPEKKKGK